MYQPRTELGKVISRLLVLQGPHFDNIDVETAIKQADSLILASNEATHWQLLVRKEGQDFVTPPSASAESTGLK